MMERNEVHVSDIFSLPSDQWSRLAARLRFDAAFGSTVVAVSVKSAIRRRIGDVQLTRCRATIF